MATIPDVTDGDVVLRGSYGDSFGYGYRFEVARMQARAEWRADRWTVRVDTGRVPLTREAIEDIEETVRRIGVFFFGEGAIMELSAARFSIGFRCAESVDELVRLADTKARRRTPDGAGYVFGSRGGGTQFWILPSATDNSSDQQKMAELVFGRPRVLETMRGMSGPEEHNCIALPCLVRELVRSAVGDEDMPGFFRLVKGTPCAWPLYRRKTSGAWRGVRRAFLDALGDPEASEPARAEPSGTKPKPSPASRLVAGIRDRIRA